ncbi:hypothetical protein ACQEU3_46535 [Spirillospora sp. CA-253888]
MTDNTAPQNTRPSTHWQQELLAEVGGGWKIWTSDADSVYATRTRTLSGEELSADLHQTVAADDRDELAAKLRQQHQKENDLAAIRRKRSA